MKGSLLKGQLVVSNCCMCPFLSVCPLPSHFLFIASIHRHTMAVLQAQGLAFAGVTHVVAVGQMTKRERRQTPVIKAAKGITVGILSVSLDVVW